MLSAKTSETNEDPCNTNVSIPEEIPECIVNNFEEPMDLTNMETNAVIEPLPSENHSVIDKLPLAKEDPSPSPNKSSIVANMERENEGEDKHHSDVYHAAKASETNENPFSSKFLEFANDGFPKEGSIEPMDFNNMETIFVIESLPAQNYCVIEMDIMNMEAPSASPKNETAMIADGTDNPLFSSVLAGMATQDTTTCDSVLPMMTSQYSTTGTAKTNNLQESQESYKGDCSKLKKGKNAQNSEKRKKKELHMQPNPCFSKNCQNKCSNISDEIRKQIHNEYSSLSSFKERKIWLLSCVTETNVKRKRSKTDIRQRTLIYHLKIDGNERRVCLQFILKTLGVSQMTVRHCLKNSSKQAKTVQDDRRGKKKPHNKTEKLIKKEIRMFIEKIPVLPSHYARKSSQRLYLPAECRNVANLYRLFVKEIEKENHQDIPSLAVFRSIFQTYNLGFHTPKKDKCSFCENMKNTPDFETNAEYLKHKQDVEESKKLFKQDQENENILCASFDLQKVLNTPHGESMLLYYSRKVAVYNLSVYESRTKRGLCYIWDETNGKRGANEIGTALEMYLRNVEIRYPAVQEVVLYCDNCAGQNKNKTILSTLQNFVKNSVTVKKVTINYLVVGHTYMPVDSIHACIENFLRKRIVYAPSQWYTIMSSARHSPKPYEVSVFPTSKIFYHSLRNSPQITSPRRVKKRRASLRFHVFRQHLSLKMNQLLLSMASVTQPSRKSR